MKFDNFETWIIKNEISIFESYLKDIKSFLDKQGVEIKGVWGELSEEEREIYTDDFIGYEEEIKKQNKILYASFLISIFSYFEYELNKICNKYYVEKSSSISLTDFTGRGIRRAKLYMKKVCKIILPKEELWRELEILNEIRNCLAHSGGEIHSNSILIKYSITSKKIQIKESKQTKTKNLEITKEYCIFAIETIREYLLTLVKDNVKNGRWWR